MAPAKIQVKKSADAAVQGDDQEESGAIRSFINVFERILRSILSGIRRINHVARGIQHIEVIVVYRTAERVAPKQISVVIVAARFDGILDHPRREGKITAGTGGTTPRAAINKIAFPSARS